MSEKQELSAVNRKARRLLMLAVVLWVVAMAAVAVVSIIMRP